MTGTLHGNALPDSKSGAMRSTGAAWDILYDRGIAMLTRNWEGKAQEQPGSIEGTSSATGVLFAVRYPWIRVRGNTFISDAESHDGPGFS